MTSNNKNRSSFSSTGMSLPFLRQPDVARRAGIDPTCVAIADAPVGSDSAFSFAVIGDTDAGQDTDGGASFSAQFAQQMMAHLGESRFLLHTGDVAYPIGNYKNYFERFLKPYQQLLTGLPNSAFYRRGAVTFKRPFMVVPGNHDCAKRSAQKHEKKYWPLMWGRVFLNKVCDRLRLAFNLDFGWYGGEGGEAYAETFLDDLGQLSPAQLESHLANHYSASIAGHHPGHHFEGATTCLSYRPGTFTRLPNRYYRFRYAGVDFFGLDSNTWNKNSAAEDFDQAQLDWLEQALIASWQAPDVIGRIVYLHHSPYTTESFHWQQSQTLWVRRHLRAVLDRVAIALDHSPAQVPLLDLVLSGHAHCLEHLRTAEGEHGDAGIDWVVCGGSGFDLRKQRRDSLDILENVVHQGRSRTEVVAHSQFYAGRHRQSQQQFRQRSARARKLHSFIRVDVQPNQAQKITVCPFLVTCEDGQWKTKPAAPFSVGLASERSQRLMRA